MTNRYNVNRKYVKKIKIIRDRKKAHIVGRKRKEEKVEEVVLTKKETRRQERIDKIYTDLKLKPSDIQKKSIKRRPNNLKKGGKYCIVKSEKNSNEMEVEQ